MPAEIDRKINEAFERLTRGRPEITDGALTVSNICTEAGVSRATYYRSPLAAQIKQRLDTPTRPRPEIESLREQVKQLKQTERRLRSEHATQIRELQHTVKTYANQIQALALRAAQLEDDYQRLATRSGNLTPLKHR